MPKFSSRLSQSSAKGKGLLTLYTVCILADWKGCASWHWGLHSGARHRHDRLEKVPSVHVHKHPQATSPSHCTEAQNTHKRGVEATGNQESYSGSGGIQLLQHHKIITATKLDPNWELTWCQNSKCRNTNPQLSRPFFCQSKILSVGKNDHTNNVNTTISIFKRIVRQTKRKLSDAKFIFLQIKFSSHLSPQFQTNLWLWKLNSHL